MYFPLSFVDYLHKMHSYLFHHLWGISPLGNPHIPKPVSKEYRSRWCPQLEIITGPVWFLKCRLKDSWYNKSLKPGEGSAILHAGWRGLARLRPLGMKLPNAIPTQGILCYGWWWWVQCWLSEWIPIWMLAINEWDESKNNEDRMWSTIFVESNSSFL